MTTCTDCGRDISERARACPGCGAPGPGAGQLIVGTSGPAPSGIELASWGARAGAFLLDAAIIGLSFLILAFGLMGGARISSGADFSLVPMFFLFLMSVLYKPLMEGSMGATVGKTAVKIKVVSADTGAQCDYAKAFIRWAVGVIIIVVPFGSFIDNLWPLWDERKQALHDKVAGTLVVRAD